MEKLSIITMTRNLRKPLYPVRSKLESERNNSVPGNSFPAKENTALTIQTDKPVTTTIYLRYPSWSKNVKVNVNGKKYR